MPNSSTSAEETEQDRLDRELAERLQKEINDEEETKYNNGLYNGGGSGGLNGGDLMNLDRGDGSGRNNRYEHGDNDSQHVNSPASDGRNYEFGYQHDNLDAEAAMGTGAALQRGVNEYL